jgi:hypothetical protein
VLPNDNNEFEDQPVFPPKVTSKVTSVLIGKILWSMGKRNDVTSIAQSRKGKMIQSGTVQSGSISTTGHRNTLNTISALCHYPNNCH